MPHSLDSAQHFGPSFSGSKSKTSKTLVEADSKLSFAFILTLKTEAILS
jgi:hypothetical protein